MAVLVRSKDRTTNGCLFMTNAYRKREWALAIVTAICGTPHSHLTHPFFCSLLLLSSVMAESRKPDKLYATHPKGYGKGSRACRVTGRMGGNGLVRKYGINMKRQVFRERAIDMGWSKYN
jgi:small subunit ribosomal protein S29e